MSTWVKLPPKRRQVAIAGTVIDEQTQQPLIGAQVKITQAPAEFMQKLRLFNLQWRDRDITRSLDQTETASDGWFYFVDLPIGNYTLTASLPKAGGRYQPSSTKTITVTESTKTNQPDKIPQPIWTQLTLRPTTLKGTIQDGTDQPVVMAKIWIEGSDDITFSNAKGEFALIGLEGWRADQSTAQTPPKLAVKVAAVGYKIATQTVALKQGEIQTLTIQLQ